MVLCDRFISEPKYMLICYGIVVAVAAVIFSQALAFNPLPTTTLANDTFPDDFLFGCSSSAYQVEGAWNKDGRGESIWDRQVHLNNEVIADGSSGDVASNSYELYGEDIKALKHIGANFYRFSISWSRILPDGDISSLNEAGLAYYDAVINALLANGIEPMVTMYHMDLPQRLQELGGWANRYIVDYFEQYAGALYARYADRVKYWNTINEAALFCASGYNGDHAPRRFSPGIGEYLCTHHVLLSHARAYRLYDRQYRARYSGKISIALNSNYAWPKNPDDPKDVRAAERNIQFQLGLYSNPIFGTGDYPDVVREYVDRLSLKEKRSKSRLPKFTAAEIQSLRGSADFFGLNYYTSNYATPGLNSWYRKYPCIFRDQYVLMSKSEDWPQSESHWLRSMPDGLRGLLGWIKDRYGNPEVIVTENGWSDLGERNDNGRIDYLRTHLEAVLNARLLDGCNVTGYTHWSIIDNFEWNQGFTKRFGLFHVDFDSDARTRTPKRSAAAYRDIIRSRKIPKELPAPVPDEP